MKYSKHLFEVLVIFASVMMAFLAEDLREQRQDLQDFNLIIDEIEVSVRLDMNEIEIDLRDIQNQIHSLSRLIYDGVNLPSDSLNIFMRNVMITHWPQYNSTGFDQLRNSKNEGTKPERLMRAIYDYYLFANWQGEITPSFFGIQLEKLREYLISEGLSPAGAGVNYAFAVLPESDIDAYRKALSNEEFIVRLKHLRDNRSHELEIFEYMWGKGSRLLEFFNPDFGYESIGIVGSATENGWDADIRMENVRKDFWKTELSLKDGAVKFRAEGSWTYNWGGTDFPDGLGLQDGPSIPVSAGQYIITFEAHSEMYSFTKID